MNKKTFIEYCNTIWGGRGWQVRMAKEIGYSDQQVSNWCRGQYPIPLLVQLYVALRFDNVSN